VTAALLAASPSRAQWEIQPSPTTSDLRGIHSLGNGIAWASGSNGAVLRTNDDGAHWQLCPTPPSAEHLDFRGIQAFDASTAIVMSSGKGTLSRLYKTTDACRTWTLLFTNPDPEGFWDALSFDLRHQNQPLYDKNRFGVVIGDPVDGKVAIFVSENMGDSWRRWGDTHGAPKGSCGEHAANARRSETSFAASNESIVMSGSWDKIFLFITGGPSGSRLRMTDFHSFDGPPCWTSFTNEDLDFGKGTESSGAFAASVSKWQASNLPTKMMIVGGDYKKPEEPAHSLLATPIPAFNEFRFMPSVTPPHGFRSSVAYSAPTNTWITVGPNGTDISTDDGRNWRALRPTPAEPPDADRDWNALSLPFVVGPHGRIGHLRPAALIPPPASAPKAPQP
jgi:hypothetical protein